VPCVSLDPQEIGAWARMEMDCAGSTDGLVVRPLAATAGAPPSLRPVKIDGAVADLCATSPEAFRLAVALASGPFTLPVARLIQEVRLGSRASQTRLAEVLLSGLVVARVPPGAAV